MFEEKIAEMNQAAEAINAGNSSIFADCPGGKRTYTVDEIQDILSISRSSAYNLIRQNLFRSVRIGGSIRVSCKSFDAWLDQA